MAQSTNEKILMMNERFYILGCQRSGTTLMRLILEVHTRIFCFDETQSYSILQNSSVFRIPESPLIGFKIPRWTEQILHANLSDDGPEGSCSNFYKNEKIIFMIRDVRDTITSMFNLRYGDTNWCELWVPGIMARKMEVDPSFRQDYARELELIEAAKSSLVGHAALYWKYKTDAFFTYRQKGLPIAAVSYEKLVTDPLTVLNSVCAHLGVPFEDKLLRHNDFPHEETDLHGLTVGNTDATLPIVEKSVGSWEKFLNDEDMELISQIVGGLPERCAQLFTV